MLFTHDESNIQGKKFAFVNMIVYVCEYSRERKVYVCEHIHVMFAAHCSYNLRGSVE